MVQYTVFKSMGARDAQKFNLLKKKEDANPAQITLITILPTIHVFLVTKTQCIMKQQGLVNV